MELPTSGSGAVAAPFDSVRNLDAFIRRDACDCAEQHGVERTGKSDA